MVCPSIRIGGIIDFRCRNHPLASEILTNFEGQKKVSHRIEASYVVISAALAYQNHASTIEAKPFIRGTLAYTEK